MLGGAVGDALGAPVEFWGAKRIEERVGVAGVRDFLPVSFGDTSGVGLITDDTQMTLFTLEGIIRAINRQDRGVGFTVGVLQHAYLRWLDTQQLREPSGERDGWLQGQRWLYSRRAPGNTCLAALQATDTEQFGDAARNDSKGCGGVMRSAPLGLLTGYSVGDDHFAYRMASDAAGFTHGHPTGQSASGAMALLINRIVRDEPLTRAVTSTLEYLAAVGPDAAETSRALTQAVDLAGRGEPSGQQLALLGEGWIAEEALAMSVYCALAYPGREQMLDALALAVTHGGDSDSTGAICGNILGALHGQQAVPAQLQIQLEGRGTILELCDDFVMAATQPEAFTSYDEHNETWRSRYPGW